MSDDATPRLILPYLAAGQAQKHVTLNEALARLDALVQTAALSRTTDTQPASPGDGDLYIMTAGASGADWAGKDEGALMRFEAGAWAEVPVGAGLIAWIADEESVLLHDGTDWTTLSDHLRFTAIQAAASASGATVRFEVREEDVALSGASVDTVIVIPDRAIVFGVSTRTLTTVTGATAYDCGIAGEADKFGGSLGAAAGSTNIGVIGPTAFYADTAVRLTAVGSDFTGGSVRVAIQLIAFDPPGAA